jgi:DNA end-binding protein Ku
VYGHQLIKQMTSDWKPEQFKDDFTSAVRALVQRKAKAGEKASVEPFEEAPALGESNVIDLTDLLRQSLGSKAKAGRSSSAAAAKKSADKPIPIRSAGRASPKGKKAA